MHAVTSQLRSLTLSEGQPRSEASCGRTRPDPTRGGWPTRPCAPASHAHPRQPEKPNYASLELLRAYLVDEGWRGAFD